MYELIYIRCIVYNNTVEDRLTRTDKTVNYSATCIYYELLILDRYEVRHLLTLNYTGSVTMLVK